MTNSNHFILANDSNCYTFLTSFLLHNKKHSFLVDSGASLSAIKYKHVLEYQIPIHKESVKIKGLGGEVEAKGYIYLPLCLGNEIINHKFYVFNNLPIEAQGILGRDFLNMYKAQIDFYKNNLTLYTNKTAYFFPIVNKCKVDINVPARSESVHFIQTEFNEDCVVSSQEINEGVFLASSVATPINGFIPIRILNVTENDFLLSDISPKIEKLKNFNICAFEKPKK